MIKRLRRALPVVLRAHDAKRLANLMKLFKLLTDGTDLHVTGEERKIMRAFLDRVDGRKS